MFNPDNALAAIARYVLDRNLSLPQGRIDVSAAAGWITLSGRLDHSFQKRVAEELVRHLPGVTGLTSQITVIDTAPAAWGGPAAGPTLTARLP